MKTTTWLLPLVVLGAALLSAGLWARQALAAQRAQAWGITAKVAQRLQTDEGARQLYLANPELKARSASESAFLEEVRAHRASFGALPPQEPREGFVCFPSLTSFTAQVRGTDGSWMELQVQGPSLFDEVRGEGLHLLHFAQGRPALMQESPAEKQVFDAAYWKKFQGVLAALGTPNGAKALWRQEPGIHLAFPHPEDLVAWADTQRGVLVTIPRGEWTLVVKVSLRRERSSEGEAVSLDYDLGSRSLRMTWRGERLVFLGLVVPD